MLLQRLSEYAGRLNLPPNLYSEVPVRYIIDLDSQGRLLSPRPVDTADPGNPRTKFGKRFLMPQVKRTSGVKPLLLVGNAEYTLGLARDAAKEERTSRCHRSYIALIDLCAHATGEPAVRAVQTFLHAGPASQLELDEGFDLGANITFRVDGTLPVDLPSVQSFWSNLNDPANAKKPAPVMQCLVCGQERPVLDRLQGSIKGIPGGQTSGTALISANAGAFESYGLEASLIAPTCPTCGERFTKAANGLLADRTHSFRLGKVAFIWWTRAEVPFALLDYFDKPTPEQVRALLTAVSDGRPPAGVDQTAFYAVSLSASGGRAVVRDWLDTTLGEVKRNLGVWFARQAVVSEWGDEPRPLGLYGLAAATVRDLNADLAAQTPRALLRGALTGAPLPWDLLYQAVRRNRAEQNVTRQRAALIKLVLASQGILEEDTMVQLDLESQVPAYRCGRLLAVLERAQELAVPGIKATIVDRFFGTASSAPASVFGRLLRGAQPHLAKLKRDRPGVYVRLQSSLEEVQAGLSGFPRTLTLEEQGLFALGYYHQRAADRARAKEARARRQENEPSEMNDDDTANLEEED